MNIGFIGTGVMGSRMVQRLLHHGFQVHVYNRTKEKVKPLLHLGAIHEESIASLAQKSHIILTCLSMPEDVIAVYSGKSGILENARPGTVCMDLTTAGADTGKTVFEEARKYGIEYLDCPVSGGPEGAESGTLTIMVGGERQAFEKNLSVLDVLGDTVEYLGPSGSGSMAKLLNQYLVAVHSLAASEAMVTGAALGLDSEQLYRILTTSYGDSRILRRHMQQYVFDRQFAPGGAVKYVHKDVRLANQLIQEAGIKQFSGQLAEQAFRHATETGLGDMDMSAVIQPLEQQCGVIVKKNG
ncbi:NAD(P)-dependent oxidoreductase [Neobacillus sp. Marseille-QA0830]